MDKVLSISNYGISLFSLEVLQDFLKQEKIRSKKLLDKFQKDKKLYLTTQKEGIWLPLVQIDGGEYIIRIDGQDAPFDEEWELKLEYDGFNMEIKDSLCISDIGRLNFFDADEMSQYECSYQTLDGITGYTSFKYDVPSGKYLVSVKGYARKGATGHSSKKDNPQYGFLFSLVKVDAFDGFKNPRESELYEFNIGWLTRTREAVVEWFSEAEGGRKEPPTEEEYYPVIELEDGKLCYLQIRFDRTNSAQNKMTDNCRVCVLYTYSFDSLLSGNAEYVICEESRKRGKRLIQKTGRLIIL